MKITTSSKCFQQYLPHNSAAGVIESVEDLRVLTALIAEQQAEEARKRVACMRGRGGFLDR